MYTSSLSLSLLSLLQNVQHYTMDLHLGGLCNMCTMSASHPLKVSAELVSSSYDTQH